MFGSQEASKEDRRLYVIGILSSLRNQKRIHVHGDNLGLRIGNFMVTEAWPTVSTNLRNLI
jgi:hypothetical protein